MKLWQYVFVFLASMLLAMWGVDCRVQVAMDRCADRGKMMQMETKFSHVSGCYVLTKDGWRPVSTTNIGVSKP